MSTTMPPPQGGHVLLLLHWCRCGDRAKSRPHRLTCYEIDETGPGEPFILDLERALFVLYEQHFARPPDWHLQLVRDPREWFAETMAAIHVAQEPFAPRPN